MYRKKGNKAYQFVTVLVPGTVRGWGKFRVEGTENGAQLFMTDLPIFLLAFCRAVTTLRSEWNFES